jgi:hypothetical protein
MTNARLTGHRGASAAVLAVGGGGLAAATWVAGDHGLAIGLVAFYAVASVAAYIWSGRDSDVGTIMRAGGDERQRRLDRDATALSGRIRSNKRTARHLDGSPGFDPACPAGLADDRPVRRCQDRRDSADSQPRQLVIEMAVHHGPERRPASESTGR